MDQVKIEGGILGESFAFKQENTTNTYREIVEIGIEDIISEDDDVSEENGEFEDQYNTETSWLPEELALTKGDSRQIEITGENVANSISYEFKENSELNCEEVTIQENEESDFINAALKYGRNQRINSQNTSLNNKILEERNGGKLNESLLFSPPNSEKTTPKNQSPVIENAPVVQGENSLFYKLLTSKRSDKKDGCNDQTIGTISECDKKNDTYPIEENNEIVCSNSNSISFSMSNELKSTSKNTCPQRVQKAADKRQLKGKTEKQGKSKEKSTEINDKSNFTDVSEQEKTVNAGSEQENSILDIDAADCDDISVQEPKGQSEKGTDTSVDRNDKNYTDGEMTKPLSQKICQNQNRQKDNSKNQIEISRNEGNCNNKNLLGPGTSLSTQKKSQGLPLKSNLALVNINGGVYLMHLPITGKSNQVKVLVKNASMNNAESSNHQRADLSSKHTNTSGQKLNNKSTNSQNDKGSTNNKLSGKEKEIRKDQRNSSTNIKACVSVKKSGNNNENANNKLLEEKTEIRRYQNIVESRNSNINYNSEESTVSRETIVNKNKNQSKGILEKPSGIEGVKISDPFACSSDDDDDVFGNDWDLESNNDNQQREAESDKIQTKRKPESRSEIERTPCKTISNGFSNTFSFNFFPRNVNRILEQRANSSFHGIALCEFKNEGNDEYRCSHCQEVVAGEKDIKWHIRQYHRKKRKCPYCHKESNYLKNHIYHNHTDEKDIKYFRCDLCDYKAKVKQNLDTHRIYKHTEREEMMDRIKKCDLCSKTYKHRHQLMIHKQNVHNKNTEYQCFHCDFKTFIKHSLISHVIVHMDPEKLKTHKCPHCEFTTPYRRKYYAHVFKHAEKNFQCHVCSYRTISRDKLKLHLISHKKVKDEKDWKYKCDKCDYKTYRQYSLQIHKLNHLKPGEIQYFYCYHCKFKAKRKDNLKTHIHRHFKQKEVPFQCFVCNFTTKNRGELIRHVDKHSKEQRD